MRTLVKSFAYLVFISLLLWESSKGSHGNFLLTGVFLLFLLCMNQEWELHKVKKHLSHLQDRFEAAMKVKENFYQVEVGETGIVHKKKKHKGED